MQAETIGEALTAGWRNIHALKRVMVAASSRVTQQGAHGSILLLWLVALIAIDVVIFDSTPWQA
jgi:hypothetical protein